MAACGQRMLQQHKKDALRIFQAALNAVMPNQMVKSILRKEPENLWIKDKQYSLKAKRISVIGFGKAVIGMARCVQDVVGADIIHRMILSVPVGTLHGVKSELLPIRNEDVKIFEGAKNNLPDEDAAEAAKTIQSYVKELNENDILLVLISGGGSALLPAPVDGVTLADKCLVSEMLAKRGADIKELNVVRKRLSTLKGGKLAVAAWPAQVASLILSDVIDDPLDLIASGPTVPNMDDPMAAMQVVQKYKLSEELPETVMKALSEFTEKDLLSHDFAHVDNHLIGSNKIALHAAAIFSQSLGYDVFTLSTRICGEANLLGRLYANIAQLVVNSMQGEQTDNLCMVSNEPQVLKQNGVESRSLSDLKAFVRNRKNIVILSAGETVVRVTGTGCGGRNQETVLSFIDEFHADDDEILANVVFLSAGTDGQDGPTSATGAATAVGQYRDVTNYSDLKRYLENNDSNSFFKKFRPNDLIITGITGTNVMDLHILLVSVGES